MDDAALTTGSAAADGSTEDVGRSEAARRLMPSRAAVTSLNHLAELTMDLLRAAAAHLSLLTDVQTVTAAAGLSRSALGDEVPLAEALCTLTMVSNGPVVIADAAVDPRAREVPAVASGAIGAYLGAPLVTRDGRVVGALCAFDPLPREWSDAELRVLTQLAAFAVTELETASAPGDQEALRVLWELSIASAGVGTFDLDVVTGRLRWDDRLLEQFGYDRHTFDETVVAFFARAHPDDRARVDEALRACVEDGTELETEYRVVLPGGRVRWISAKGRVLRGSTGAPERLLGATLDVTGTRAGEAAVTAVLEAMSAAFFSLDRSWRFTYVNLEAEHLLQRRRAELVGGSIWDLFPASVGSDFETSYRRAMDSAELVTFDAHYPEPLDAWYEVRALPTADGLSVYFLDVTARRLAQEAAETAAERAALIAAVTSELAEHLDSEEAVGRLADLVVPTLADWCLVALVDDDARSTTTRGLRDIGFAHVDPDLLPLVEAYAACRIKALLDGSFVARALTTGQPVQLDEGATPRIIEVLAPGAAHDLLKTLAPESFVVLPLRARGRTVGLISLFRGASRPPITAEGLATAREVAGRAALALDNTRLYRQQRDLAEGLQRSLFTEPPEPDHAQVVVRYSPAAAVAQVGGDWYDAFLQRDGATVLVIGDVVGHDTQAAAAMSQVRTLLRGLGAADSAGPAELLTKVDRVMETLRVGTTATAIVARLEQDQSQLERGTNTLRWSNAGHPPAMVIQADGRVTRLTATSSDLILGVMPTTRRREHEITIDRGATVLLYTDGLVERRSQSLEVGLDRLQDVLLDLASQDLDLDSLCDQLLARMLPPRPEDDVALVAVRLHPQDRPRPAEAGPRALPDDIADEPEATDRPR